jgi:hypothetical protein
LDSLLDTMTTVVGILLIILIVLQLDVKQAVERIVRKETKSGPKVEQKDLDKKETEIKEAMARIAALKAEREEARSQAEAFATQRQSKAAKLASLQSSLNRSAKPKSTAELKKMEKELAAKLKKMEEDIKQTGVRYRELRMLLAKTPVPKKVAPNDITIPKPRPAPEGSVPFNYIVRRGIVYPIEEANLKEIVKKAVAKSGSKKNAKNEYNPAPIIAYFKKNSVGDKHFRLEAFENPGKIIQFRLHRKRAGGTTSAMLSNFNSSFRTELRKFNPKKQYAMFHVWPDSYQTYSRARSYMDRQKIPAGWTPREDKGEHQLNLGWYRTVGRTAVEEAAAAKRAKEPPKPPAKKPPPPKNVLD